MEALRIAALDNPEPRMKILQLNKLYHPVIGGIETIVRQLAEGLNGKDGLTMDVLVCNSTSATVHERVNGVSVTRASSPGIVFSMPVSLSFILLLRKMWKNYDIIHLHLPFPLAELALWLVRPRITVIITYHSDIVRQKLISSSLGWLHNWVLDRADCIAVSNPNIAATSPVLVRFRSKCTVVPFGVDTNRFRPGAGSEKGTERIKKEYGRGKKIVLFVGRLVYYKGTEHLIRAMKDTDARLVIIGEGPLGKFLAQEAAGNGLSDRITFIPYQTHEALINFYCASSVFVLPSVYRSEAFGITILEAMACGLPVISTELGTGTSYANLDGVTGFVVPAGDSPAIGNALRRLLSDPALSAGMGSAARRRAEAAFTIGAMLDGYKKIYACERGRSQEH